MTLNRHTPMSQSQSEQKKTLYRKCTKRKRQKKTKQPFPSDLTVEAILTGHLKVFQSVYDSWEEDPSGLIYM